MAATEKDYIVLYRTLAGEKLLLGNGGKLKLRDFEYLSTAIEEKSKVKLSVSTLKRLWKDDFTLMPHPATLDALASVLDFSTWQDFKKEFAAKVNGQTSPKETHKRKVPASLYIIAGFALLTGGFFVLQAFNKLDKKVPVKIPFTADKTVTVGVPNTVMFNYDFRNVEADSFFIQQSWNPRNKTAVDPNHHYFSAIYYEPGFHWARLMADDSIVTFASVHIKTDGWLPLVKYDIRDKTPLYLDMDKIMGGGELHTTRALLQEAHVDVSKDFRLHYYNIRDFENVDSDNFDIETRLKCDGPNDSHAVSNLACPMLQLTIVTEEDEFFVPITSRGCGSELELKIGDVYKSGADHNLSALCASVFDWQTLRVNTQGKKAIIYLNQVPIQELTFEKNFGKIKGLIFTFTGPGSVDFVRLKNKLGEMVYQDEFDQPAL
jgi:hypothetical protein